MYSSFYKETDSRSLLHLTGDLDNGGGINEGDGDGVMFHYWLARLPLQTDLSENTTMNRAPTNCDYTVTIKMLYGFSLIKSL